MLASIRKTLPCRDPLSQSPPTRVSAFCSRQQLDPILILNNDRRCVDANSAACEVLGYTKSELLSLTIDDLVPAEEHAEVPARWARFVSVGSSAGERVLCRKDGTRRFIEFRGTANFVPGLHLAFIRDLTERRVADMALQKQKKLRISAGLRPTALDQLGLVDALQWQSEEFERRTGVRCRLESHVDGLHLEHDRATQVFRIAQEALTNTTRDARASRVRLRAELRAGRFVLEIRDNGRGISDIEIQDRCPSACWACGSARCGQAAS